MLDEQMNTKRNLGAYGNMTEAEKKMNRNDLVSYKYKEGVSYGLIPGQLSTTQSPTRTVQEKMDKRMHKPNKTMQTIDDFGKTYLGIPDMRAQESRFQQPAVNFPDSGAVGGVTYASKKVHPLYQSVDPTLSNL